MGDNARDYAEAIVDDVLADAQRDMCIDYVTERLEPVFAIYAAAREYLRLESLYHTTRRTDVNVLLGQAHDALVAAVEGK